MLRFRRHNLALDIPISWVDLPKGGLRFPVLRMTDTIKYLARADFLNKLVGEMNMAEIEPTLLTFWRRFAVQHSDHEVFQANIDGRVSLARSIPIVIHGGEGRGFKRTGIMMLSIQGCIGRGSRPFLEGHSAQQPDSDPMGVNMFGGSFNSRLLFGAMAKKHYSTHPDAQVRFKFFVFGGRLKYYESQPVG